MKKLLTFAFTLIICMSLAACGSGKVPSNFTGGYEKAVFSKFNSFASNNGLAGRRIYLEGIIDKTSIIDTDIGKGIIGYLRDNDKNNWLVILQSTIIANENEYNDIIGKPIILCGVYQGYSTKEKMPTINLIELCIKETGEIKSGIGRLSSNGEKPTSILETDKSKSDRNISGFNQKTNQTLSFYGIDFSFPSYFDVLSEDSTETKKIFYPKKTEYYASLEFNCVDFSGTQEDFNNKIPTVVDSVMGNEAYKNAKIQKSEKNTIAGMPGWTLSFLIQDKDKVSPASYSFVYNKNVKKIIGIFCVYDNNDQSNYDYLGDYVKILETAVLSPKE